MPKLGPQPPVPGVVKIELLGSLTGIPTANIFHASYGGSPPTSTQAQTLANNLIGAFRSAFQALVSTEYNCTLCRVTDLSSPSGAVAESAAGWSGTLSSQPLPNQTAMLVNWLVGRRYRGGHPRSYIAGLSQIELGSPTSWDPAYLGEWQIAVNSWHSSLNGGAIGSFGPFSHVNVHMIHLGAYVVPPVVDAILSGAPNPTPGTQRKRLH